MNLVSEDIELIKKLLESDTVNFYDLHDEFLLSPAQVATAVERLSIKEFVTLDGMSVSLTEKGKGWLRENAGGILTHNRKQYWKELPSNMLQPSIGINEFYKPNIDKNKKEGKILER